MQPRLELDDEAATVWLGTQLAPLLAPLQNAGALVYLQGDLGAGKTTLVRGLLRALGHPGAVKSPTFTLVEPYQTGRLAVYHFDLYRLEDPEELEFLGMDDYLRDDALCLVEWPEKGAGRLPEGDLVIKLNHKGHGREAVFMPRSARGEQVCVALLDLPEVRDF